MAKFGRFWREGESGYSNEDCNKVNKDVIACINNYLQTMRVDDYKYLAEQKGIAYFRDALESGKVIVDVEGVAKYLKNLKDKEEIKEKIHEVVNNIKDISIEFSEEYKKDHQKVNQ